MSSSFSERKSIILEMLMEESSVSVSDLAKRLNVTVVTARADLAALEEEGLLVRTHGGAIPAQHPKIMERMQAQKRGKSSIANAVLGLVPAASGTNRYTASPLTSRLRSCRPSPSKLVNVAGERKISKLSPSRAVIEMVAVAVSRPSRTAHC